jgi:hypothetical protein
MMGLLMSWQLPDTWRLLDLPSFPLVDAYRRNSRDGWVMASNPGWWRAGLSRICDTVVVVLEHGSPPIISSDQSQFDRLSADF